MNAKRCKRLRQWVRLHGHGDPTDTTYWWVRRPDGSVVRVLQNGCGRNQYQRWLKGKGLRNVHPWQ